MVRAERRRCLCGFAERMIAPGASNAVELVNFGLRPAPGRTSRHRSRFQVVVEETVGAERHVFFVFAPAKRIEVEMLHRPDDSVVINCLLDYPFLQILWRRAERFREHGAAACGSLLVTRAHGAGAIAAGPHSFAHRGPSGERGKHMTSIRASSAGTPAGVATKRAPPRGTCPRHVVLACTRGSATADSPSWAAALP